MKEKILQIAHITNTPGPVQTLAEFIEKDKKNSLNKIYFDLGGNNVLKYVGDFGRSVWKIARFKKVDVAIGMNCFDTLPLVLLKKNRIKKVILFGTDFARRRYNNPILNWIYVTIDKYCAEKADFVCGNSQRTIKQRIKEGVDKNKIIYTPNGVFLNKVNFKNKNGFDKKLVFIGRVSKEHGMDKIIKAAIKTDIVLDIIGDGPDLKLLKKKYFKNKGIKFLGRKSHDEVLKYLTGFSGFGVAPYVLDSDWTYYCDPVKVKEYLAFGIPVIISDIPEISEKIKKEKLGYVFKNQKELELILKRVKTLRVISYLKMNKRVKKNRRDFDLDKVYRKMFDRILL